MLDQINSYLDDLEERNDALNGKMHELLESNRQARLDFRAQLLGSQTQEENCTQKEHQTAEEESSPSKDLDEENWDSNLHVELEFELDYTTGREDNMNNS